MPVADLSRVENRFLHRRSRARSLSLDKETGPGGAQTHLSPDRLVERWQDVVHVANQVPESHSDGLQAADQHRQINRFFLRRQSADRRFT